MYRLLPECKLLGQVGVVKITQPTVLGMNDFRELLCSMVFMRSFDGDRSISYIFSNKKYSRNVRFYFSKFIEDKKHKDTSETKTL